MRLLYPITTTAFTLLAVALLGASRVVGAYSHQAFAFALVVGLAWAVASRGWLAWRGRLHRRFPWEWSRPANHSLRAQVLARGAFWLMLGAAAVAVFPRSDELTPYIAGVAVLALLRVGASAFPSTTPNPGPSVVAGLGALMLLMDLGVAFWPTAAPVVRLQPPFSGEWIVLQGGHSPMQSHHTAAYNQLHALDLVRVLDGKIFVEGGEGNALASSWEAPLLAPVAGRVVVARDTMEDSVGMNLVARQEDAVGNVIIIETDTGHFVLLAHLRHGSLQVAEGDVVTAGQPIAKAGNSGNTTISHLHLQVQTHVDIWDPDNRSVPFAFGPEGRTLRRNDRVGN